MDLPQNHRAGLGRFNPPKLPSLPTGDIRGKLRRQPKGYSTLGSSWRRTLLRGLWMGCSVGVLLYSIAVLTHVARMGSIGVRCMFGTKVEEVIPADYVWRNSRPQDRRHAADQLVLPRFTSGVIPTTSGRCGA